jgi:hypothetical protein
MLKTLSFGRKMPIWKKAVSLIFDGNEISRLHFHFFHWAARHFISAIFQANMTEKNIFSLLELTGTAHCFKSA